MRRTTPAILALSLAAAVPAGAAEFIPGWTAETVWSSNVFRSLDEDQNGRSIPKEDDFSLRTGPSVRLREPQGDLKYDLRYRLRYEEFLRLDGISEFDHLLNGRADWAVTDRTTLSISDDYADAASLNGIFEGIGPDADLTVRGDRTRVKTNSAYASARHSLGPLWELTVAGDHQLYEYEADGASDSSSMSGSVQLTRALTPRLVVGMGGTTQRQEFQATDVLGEDTGTTFFQAFGIANYRFSRTFRVSVSGGPALSMPDDVDSREVNAFDIQPFDIDTCPVDTDGVPIVPLSQSEIYYSLIGARRGLPTFDSDQCQVFGVDLGTAADPNIFVPVSSERVVVPATGDSGVENTLTYFARIQIEKSWRLWTATLSYSRSASNGSGLGTSTLVDTINGQLTFTPTQYWTISLQGIASLQSAISEVNEQLLAVRSQQRDVLLRSIEDGSFETVNLDVPVPFELRAGDKIDNPIDIKTYRIELRADRRITRNLTANSSASWYQQTNSNRFQDTSRNEFRLLVGLTWNFDAIPL